MRCRRFLKGPGAGVKPLPADLSGRVAAPAYSKDIGGGPARPVPRLRQRRRLAHHQLPRQHREPSNTPPWSQASDALGKKPDKIVDWRSLVAWDSLEAVRADLDQLPHPRREADVARL